MYMENSDSHLKWCWFMEMFTLYDVQLLPRCLFTSSLYAHWPRASVYRLEFSFKKNLNRKNKRELKKSVGILLAHSWPQLIWTSTPNWHDHTWSAVVFWSLSVKISLVLARPLCFPARSSPPESKDHASVCFLSETATLYCSVRLVSPPDSTQPLVRVLTTLLHSHLLGQA